MVNFISKWINALQNMSSGIFLKRNKIIINSKREYFFPHSDFQGGKIH